MSSAIVPLMDIESAMSNALNIGADVGRKTANGMVMGMKGCSTCIHAKDVFVPCDWLAKQEALVLDCPHYAEKVKLEDIVDLDAQTKVNNEAMRKVIDFLTGERKTDG